MADEVSCQKCMHASSGGLACEDGALQIVIVSHFQAADPCSLGHWAAPACVFVTSTCHAAYGGLQTSKVVMPSCVSQVAELLNAHL